MDRHDPRTAAARAAFASSERAVPPPVSDALVWAIAGFPAVAALLDFCGGFLPVDGLLLKAVLGGIDVALVAADAWMVRAAGMAGPGFLWGVVFDPVYVRRRRVLTGRDMLPFYLSVVAIGVALAGAAYAAYAEATLVFDGLRELEGRYPNWT